MPPPPPPVVATLALTMRATEGDHLRADLDARRTFVAELVERIAELLQNLAQLPDAQRTAIRNNGGGHVNHTQFWSLMAPKAGGAPTGAIAEALRSTFGSVDKFKEVFAAAATSRFGSGWAWLSDEGGTLVVHSTANQDTPSMEKKRAIFGLDVWEHAYYLQYQNRRPDYVAAFWNVIDWTEVNRRLKA